jgi:DNA-binding NtrC family response regulator
MARDILIIEDEDAVRQVLTASLTIAGHKILSAANGKEMEAVIAAHPSPNDLLILVDIALENESGIDLATALTKRFPEVRILFISGYVDNVVMLDSTLGGAHIGFLHKPFNHVELLSAVQRMCA